MGKYGVRLTLKIPSQHGMLEPLHLRTSFFGLVTHFAGSQESDQQFLVLLCSAIGAHPVHSVHSLQLVYQQSK